MNPRKKDKLFGNKAHENGSTFGGTCHPGIESNGKENTSGDDCVVDQDVSIEGNNDAFPGENGRPTGSQVRFDDAEDAADRSRSRFSKRDQLWVDRVRRLQHVTAFP